MRTHRQLFIWFSFTVASSQMMCLGEILFSNTNQPTSGYDTFFGETFAGAFMTGTNETVLTGLSFRSGGGGPALDVPTAFLYQDSAGHPGSLLTTFVPVSPTVNFNVVTMISYTSLGVALQPNHVYWIGLRSENNFFWYTTPSTTTDSASESQFMLGSAPSTAYSFDGGSTWTSFLSDQAYEFALSGTILVVPEPNTVLLFGMTALGGAIIRRQWAAESRKNP